MEELGLLYSGSSARGFVPGYPLITVRPGPVTLKLTGELYWGKLPEGTLISGERIFTERRVQGRPLDPRAGRADDFRWPRD